MSAVREQCSAGSPTVRIGGAEPESRRCELDAWHPGYHANGFLSWRDPEPILGEPKPWHPNHRPHDDGQCAASAHVDSETASRETAANA